MITPWHDSGIMYMSKQHVKGHAEKLIECIAHGSVLFFFWWWGDETGLKAFEEGVLSQCCDTTDNRPPMHKRRGSGSQEMPVGSAKCRCVTRLGGLPSSNGQRSAHQSGRTRCGIAGPLAWRRPRLGGRVGDDDRVGDGSRRRISFDSAVMYQVQRGNAGGETGNERGNVYCRSHRNKCKVSPPPVTPPPASPHKRSRATSVLLSGSCCFPGARAAVISINKSDCLRSVTHCGACSDGGSTIRQKMTLQQSPLGQFR